MRFSWRIKAIQCWFYFSFTHYFLFVLILRPRLRVFQLEDKYNITSKYYLCCTSSPQTSEAIYFQRKKYHTNGKGFYLSKGQYIWLRSVSASGTHRQRWSEMVRGNFGRGHTYFWMIWYNPKALYSMCRSGPGNPREASGCFILVHVFGQSLQPLPATAHYHCNCLAVGHFSLCWSTNVRAVSQERRWVF